MDYKEKLKEALNSDNTDYEVVRWIEQNFPELKESEDERIRKQLIEHTKWSYDEQEISEEEKERWISWLEKQGEQKPAEWTERDSKISNAIIKKLGSSDALCVDLAEAISWVSSVKERVQPRQEWSEEDEDYMHRVIRVLKDNDPDWAEFTDWLKSLRPQNRWKPSDEQMVALNIAIEMEDGDILKSLYQDLLKLKFDSLKSNYGI